VPFLKLRLENACGPVRCTCVKGSRQRPAACRLRPRAGPIAAEATHDDTVLHREKLVQPDNRIDAESR